MRYDRRVIRPEPTKRDEPLSPMLATAIALNEWFRALLDAGFSEEQALKLITAAMLTNPPDSE